MAASAAVGAVAMFPGAALGQGGVLGIRNAEYGLKVNGPISGHGLCSEAMIGDWNGDGIDDFAFGACHEHNDRGAVYVVFGGRHLGDNSSPPEVNLDGLVSRGEGTVILGPEDGSLFGFSLASAPHYGNPCLYQGNQTCGKPDLVVGAPGGATGKDVFGNPSGPAGAVWLVHGAARGRTVNLADGMSALATGALQIREARDPNARVPDGFGVSVASSPSMSGGDTTSELIVADWSDKVTVVLGAPGITAPAPAPGQPGRFSYSYPEACTCGKGLDAGGGPVDHVKSFQVLPPPPFAVDNPPGTTDSSSGSWFASVAGGGDFNRDGVPDVAIGLPNMFALGPDRGAAFVVSGKDDERSVDLSAVMDRSEGGRAVRFRRGLLGQGAARLGAAVGFLGGGSGPARLVLGAPMAPASLHTGVGQAAGQVYILDGGTYPNGAAPPIDLTPLPANAAVIDGANGFQSGTSIETSLLGFGVHIPITQDFPGDHFGAGVATAATADGHAGAGLLVAAPYSSQGLDTLSLNVLGQSFGALNQRDNGAAYQILSAPARSHLPTELSSGDSIRRWARLDGGRGVPWNAALGGDELGGVPPGAGGPALAIGSDVNGDGCPDSSFMAATASTFGAVTGAAWIEFGPCLRYGPAHALDVGTPASIAPEVNAPGPSSSSWTSLLSSVLSQLPPSLQGFLGTTGGALAIDPALPDGLSFNGTTGIISGTPTAPLAPRTYTVFSDGILGAARSSFSLSVAGTSTPDGGDPPPGGGDPPPVTRGHLSVRLTVTPIAPGAKADVHAVVKASTRAIGRVTVSLPPRIASAVWRAKPKVRRGRRPARTVTVGTLSLGNAAGASLGRVRLTATRGRRSRTLTWSGRKGLRITLGTAARPSIDLRNLPAGTAKVDLVLAGRRTGVIRLPRRCTTLAFRAAVSGASGPRAQVPVRIPLCRKGR